MAFQTYQCEKYIEYLKQHKIECKKIYGLIKTSPFTHTAKAKACNMTYANFKYHLSVENFSSAQLTALLNFIK